MSTAAEDPFDLARFVSAQEPLMREVLAELSSGRKTSHWMWFIFPQLKGLGFSAMAGYYGIASRAEAEAYLRHPVLGPRLIECTKLVNSANTHSAGQIFGDIDSLKFRSSMTLFAALGPGTPVFAEALEKYFGGKPDSRTLDLLSRPPAPS
ncbi:MAG TPA: DUF1810 domain-containing protein [Bryobacteraceae bacterium]|nr:DUF1810 domain-containing protein [Bryobacteraceae bacterium]